MNSYMAIWYHCNQHCTGCPCMRNTDRTKSMTLDDVRHHVKQLVDANMTQEPIQITMSGGEPTLHPDFFEILDVMRENSIRLTILSNGEKFGSRAFCDTFLAHCDILNTHIVTTIHSSTPEIHERQNGSIGSFDKSITGLQYLHLRGIGVTVKHCVTNVNIKDTLRFVKMVDDCFHPSVDIELWGIDYCGLTFEQAKPLFMPFREMQPWLEEALDECIRMNARNGRRVQLCNIPLCAVDPFYWTMFRLRRQHAAYGRYFDPQHALLNQEDDSGTFSDKCSGCAVQEMCGGTYRSMFTYFGSDTVTPVACYEKGDE